MKSIWPFATRPEPDVPAGPSEVDILKYRVAAADQALTTLLIRLRVDHRPAIGVDLGPYIDLALDVRNALNTLPNAGR